MFDIGIWEMAVIGVVALVVLGPERLPKVARTVGHLVGRMQRYVAQVKTDINREMELSELAKVKTEFETAARDVKNSIETQARSAENDIKAVEDQIQRELNPPGSADSGDTAGHGAGHTAGGELDHAAPGHEMRPFTEPLVEPPLYDTAGGLSHRTQDR
jgi:sec-independent protein translocase protein TatB